MHKDLENYLIKRDVEFSLLERKNLKDNYILGEFSDSWIQMMLKVKSTPQGTQREFWEENLLTVNRLADEYKELLSEHLSLQIEYQKLYDRYGEMIEVNRNLEKDFER